MSSIPLNEKDALNGTGKFPAVLYYYKVIIVVNNNLKNSSIDQGY